jgi:hypothetical protein
LDLIRDDPLPATDFTLFLTLWDPRRLLFLLFANAELRYAFLQRDLTPPILFGRPFFWSMIIPAVPYFEHYFD